MSKEFSLKQNKKTAVLIKLETDPPVQVYVAELEIEEGVQEVVLQVFDVTLKNFVAKRISLNVHAIEMPLQPAAAGETKK